MTTLRTIIRATRAPFLAGPITSVLVGAAAALPIVGLHGWYLCLTVIGIAAVNVGLNMCNDYYDHVFRSDDVNETPTPFSGGSRVIQDGILPARAVLSWSVVAFLVGSAIGVYLAMARGPVVLWLGLAGVSIGVFTSAPPLRLNYVGHGLGELATFLGCGPLPVIGSYYVQAQVLTWEALWVSVVMGLLGTALIWINEFADYTADRLVGKQTAVVVLGRRPGAIGYGAVVVACYLCVIAGVLGGLLPLTALLVLLTLPIAYVSIRRAMHDYTNVSKIVASSAATIQLYIVNGLLLCTAYALSNWL